MSHGRRGVSLIELLCVFAIIGVLMSLLLPAVFSAFEQSSRLSCQNNWYQISLGGHMPPPPVHNPNAKALPPHSPLVAATINIEQGWIYEAYNFEQNWDSPPNDTVLRKRPGMFNCPNATGIDRSRTTYSFDVHYEARLVDGTKKVYTIFTGCEVSPEHAFQWTDPKGYNPSIIEAVKRKDGAGAFFRNHGEGHFVNAGVLKAFGGNPNGGGMEFNSDAGLIIRAWTKALNLDGQQ